MKSIKTRRRERLGERLLLLPQLLQSRRWSQKELMELYATHPFAAQKSAQASAIGLARAWLKFFSRREITFLPISDTLLLI